MSVTGFILFAHGSRVESANQAVRDIAAQLASAGAHIVEPAFLELGKPDLAEAARTLDTRGVSRIIVIPYFLTLGTHLQRDLPKLAAHAARQLGADVEIEIAPPLDGHPALLDALLDRVRQAMAGERQRA